MWDRKYQQSTDFVVVEGPLAGGHLGFSKDSWTQYGADSRCGGRPMTRPLGDEEVKAIMKVVKRI